MTCPHAETSFTAEAGGVYLFFCLDCGAYRFYRDDTQRPIGDWQRLPMRENNRRVAVAVHNALVCAREGLECIIVRLAHPWTCPFKSCGFEHEREDAVISDGNGHRCNCCGHWGWPDRAAPIQPGDLRRLKP